MHGTSTLTPSQRLHPHEDGTLEVSRPRGQRYRALVAQGLNTYEQNTGGRTGLQDPSVLGPDGTEVELHQHPIKTPPSRQHPKLHYYRLVSLISTSYLRPDRS
jgi:hypothetical protein